jgi:hypothetical protein
MGQSAQVADDHAGKAGEPGESRCKPFRVITVPAREVVPVTALIPEDRATVERARELLNQIGRTPARSWGDTAASLGRLQVAAADLLAIIGRIAGKRP